MDFYGYEFIRESDLAHHGIKGQKWGQRRFQNDDGTWTAAGKERYGDDGNTNGGSQKLSSSKNDVRAAKNAYRQAKKDFRNSPEQKAKRAANAKKALKIGAAVAGTALAAYGGYKLYQHGVNVKNAKAAAAEAEYIRKKSESGRQMYNEMVKNMMATGNGGSYGMRLADGSWLYTEWGPKKK